MSWMFAISEVLYFDRQEYGVCDDVGYVPSPIQTEVDPDNFEANMARDYGTAELVRQLLVLERYTEACKRKGLDY